MCGSDILLEETSALILYIAGVGSSASDGSRRIGYVLYLLLTLPSTSNTSFQYTNYVLHAKQMPNIGRWTCLRWSLARRFVT